MHVDPRRLQVLLSVHRHGGVLAAADATRTSASAISQQISRLEREVGTPVLDRQPSGAVLTGAGRILAEAAERIESEITDAKRSLGALGGDPTGTVTIGGFKTMIRGLLLPLVIDLRERRPGLRVHIAEAEAADGAVDLRNGHLDILLIEAEGPVGRQKPRGTKDVILLDEPWLVASPASMPEPKSLDDLAHATWLTPAADAAAYLATQRLLTRLRTATSAADRYDDYDVALAMVQAGLGVALVPALSLASIGVVPPGVQVSELAGMERRVIVARHRSTRAEPRAAVRQVIEELVEAAGALDLSSGN